MHKANKKTAFSTQKEIDWGAVPSRLCNEMRREERRPIVKASGGGWKEWRTEKRRGERRRVNKRKQKKKTKQKVRRKSGGEKRGKVSLTVKSYCVLCKCNINNVSI